MDFSLVSNKNLSEILPTNSLGLGPDKWAKKLKTTPLTMSLTKTPKTQKFFSLQTQRLADYFKGLNRSLVQSEVELCLRKDTSKLLDSGRNHTGLEGVNKSIQAFYRKNVTCIPKYTKISPCLWPAILLI